MGIDRAIIEKAVDDAIAERKRKVESGEWTIERACYNIALGRHVEEMEARQRQTCCDTRNVRWYG